MRNIVLVAGAGASYELDFPTGYGLANRIVGSIERNKKFVFGNGQGPFNDMVNQYFELTGRGPKNMVDIERNDAFFETILLPFRKNLSAWAES